MLQGHSSTFDIFLNEPGPIYLGIIEINEPFYADNDHIKNIEAYLIDRLGPRYNKKKEQGNISRDEMLIESTIHKNYPKTLFTEFMEYKDN